MSVEAHEDTDHYLYSGIIAGTALFGLTMNSIAMFILYHGGKFSHPFQQLCFSYSIANVMEMFLFFCFCCLSILFQLHEFTQYSWEARILGALMVFAWNISVISHLMVSINRLMVITWPKESQTFISKRVSNTMVAIPWIFAFVNFLPYLNVSNCYMLFDTNLYYFTYPDTPWGHIIDNIQYWSGTLSFVLVFIIDLWTLSRLYLNKKYTNEPTLLKSSEKPVVIPDQAVRFFFQSMIQALVYITALTNFFIITPMFDTTYDKSHRIFFFTNTFVWLFTQSLDGMILIPFHMKDIFKKQ